MQLTKFKVNKTANQQTKKFDWKMKTNVLVARASAELHYRTRNTQAQNNEYSA